jgi:hypothetical protein
MEFKDEDFGSNLMYAITSGLYSRDISCVREYFQNAYDPPAFASKIKMSLENNGINFVITDDGSGMDEESLKKALGVGIYTKNKDSEGIFGIGIWSGIAVCDRLVIITKKKNSKTKLRIEIKAKEIREDSTENIKLTEFLSKRTGQIEQLDASSETDNSYTIIRLEKIVETLRSTKDKEGAFSYDNLISFASKNLPLPIDPEFTFSEEIRSKFDSLFIRPVELLIDGTRVFRHINLNKHVRKPVIKTFSIKLPQEDGELKEITILKVWGSLNKEYITLPEEIRGIDFRHNGFKIEDWSDVKSIRGGTFHERWVGEIHVTIPDLLRPTADRSTFQPVPWRYDIDNQISDWLREMQSINSFVSVYISGLQKETKNLQSSDITATKKEEIVKKVYAKNIGGNLKAFENKPEYKELVDELKKEQEKSLKKFEEVQETVSAHKELNFPSRPDIKKTISSLAQSPKLADEIGTLLESKHEKNVQIDPFVTLKEEIEEKTNERYTSFTKATDAIGTKLTLYPKSKNRKENDEQLKQFLKSMNHVFRNLFEHASPETNEWFQKSRNIEKIKPALNAMIALIDLMIYEMVPLDPKDL